MRKVYKKLLIVLMLASTVYAQQLAGNEIEPVMKAMDVYNDDIILTGIGRISENKSDFFAHYEVLNLVHDAFSKLGHEKAITNGEVSKLYGDLMGKIINLFNSNNHHLLYYHIWIDHTDAYCMSVAREGIHYFINGYVEEYPIEDRKIVEDVLLKAMTNKAAINAYVKSEPNIQHMVSIPEFLDMTKNAFEDHEDYQEHGFFIPENWR